MEQNLADLPGVPGLGQQVISYLRQECACARWCCLPPPLTPELGPSVAVPMRPQMPCRQSHLQGAVAGHLTDRGCCFCYFIVILLAMPCGTWGLSSLTRDWSCAPCSRSAESQPLDLQGRPRGCCLKSGSVLSSTATIAITWLISTSKSWLDTITSPCSLSQARHQSSFFFFFLKKENTLAQRNC